jgi:hypothetical protein
MLVLVGAADRFHAAIIAVRERLDGADTPTRATPA